MSNRINNKSEMLKYYKKKDSNQYVEEDTNLKNMEFIIFCGIDKFEKISKFEGKLEEKATTKILENGEEI